MSFFNPEVAFIREQIRKQETSGGASEAHTSLATQKKFYFKERNKDFFFSLASFTLQTKILCSTLLGYARTHTHASVHLSNLYKS